LVEVEKLRIITVLLTLGSFIMRHCRCTTYVAVACDWSNCKDNGNTHATKLCRITWTIVYKKLSYHYRSASYNSPSGWIRRCL